MKRTRKWKERKNCSHTYLGEGCSVVFNRLQRRVGELDEDHRLAFDLAELRREGVLLALEDAARHGRSCRRRCRRRDVLWQLVLQWLRFRCWYFCWCHLRMMLMLMITAEE